MKKFSIYILFLYFVALTGFSFSEVAGMNNYELAEDEDFKNAVKSLISNYYFENNLRFSDAIKIVIEEYCFVENNKIKCD